LPVGEPFVFELRRFIKWVSTLGVSVIVALIQVYGVPYVLEFVVSLAGAWYGRERFVVGDVELGRDRIGFDVSHLSYQG
jgi:hypothetical protein